MRSHRLHRFATLTVNRLLVIGLVGLVLMGLMPSEVGETPEAKVTIIKAAPVQEDPYQQEYEEMLYPTVRITAGDSIGSGVAIRYNETLKHGNNETFILTAAHVVGNQSVVEVEFFSPSVLQSATVVITDTVKDLALLTTDYTDYTDIYKARLAPRNYQPYLFTPVWVVGCSLGLDPRPSSGEISAICGSYWEVSAPILPGNSGGPVFNARTYEVIGIAVWVRVYDGQLVTTMAGVVPIQTIYEFLDSHRGTETTENK